MTKSRKKSARIKIKTLYNIPSFPVNPYISAELFFPMFTKTERSVEKNRFMAGLNIKSQKTFNRAGIHVPA